MRVLLDGDLLGDEGDDRLDQRERVGRHDILRCWLFGVDFELAAAAKRADNLVTGVLDSHRGRGREGVAGGSRYR